MCACVGILQADPGVIRDKQQIFRLFCHECQRVFHDRLINREDKTYFNTILSEMSSRYFSMVCVGVRVCVWGGGGNAVMIHHALVLVWHSHLHACTHSKSEVNCCSFKYRIYILSQ